MIAILAVISIRNQLNNLKLCQPAPWFFGKNRKVSDQIERSSTCLIWNLLYNMKLTKFIRIVTFFRSFSPSMLPPPKQHHCWNDIEIFSPLSNTSHTDKSRNDKCVVLWCPNPLIWFTMCQNSSRQLIKSRFKKYFFLNHFLWCCMSHWGCFYKGTIPNLICHFLAQVELRMEGVR